MELLGPISFGASMVVQCPPTITSLIYHNLLLVRYFQYSGQEIRVQRDLAERRINRP